MKKYLTTIILSALFALFFLPHTAHANIATNMAGFWNFNESGGNRADSIDASSLSEVGGTVSSGVGKVNSAASFSGTNYFTIPDNAALSMGDIDFTISGWIYMTDRSTTRDLMMKRDSNTSREYGIFYNTTNGFSFFVSSNGSSAVSVSTNNAGSITANTWYYVVGWHDSVANTINIQMNSDTPNSLSYSSGVFNGTASFNIGAHDVGTVGLLSSGSMVDAVGVWKRVLTSGERATMYNSGNGIEFPFSDATAPAAPAFVSVIPDTSQVSLSWPAAFNNGATVTDYVIEYKLSTDVSWSVFADGVSNSLTTVVTGLANDLSYDFRVSAVNSAGTGVPSSSFTTTPHAVNLISGIAGFWSLNETSGTRTDLLGGSNLSEVGGTVTGTAGKVNNAASFSGTNYLSVPDNATLSTGDIDFSVAGWVYLTDKTTIRPIAMKRDSSSAREYGIFYSSTTGFTFAISRNGSTQNTLGTGDTAGVATNTWYYVVGWHDSVNNTINIQVNNGTVITERYSSGGFNTAASFNIGGYDSGSVALSSGSMVDAVGVWKRVLTVGEKSALYNSGAGREYPFGLNAISLSTPRSYQVIQRNSSNNADIVITGRVDGSPTAIEASWNGGPYTTIVANPTPGIFSGTLVDQVAGQGTLSVRFANSPSTVAAVPFLGIGDIYVIAGQSNASGRGNNNQVYTSTNGLRATMFGNDDTWKNLVDPTDSNVGQVDTVSSDTAGGSTWPLLASYILADQTVPVAFVPTAKGGSIIREWQKNSPSGLPTDATPYTSCSAVLDSTGLYGSMSRRINAVGPVKAILFFQGETDAGTGLTQESYEGYFNCFLNNAYADFGVATISAMIGNRHMAADALIDGIRSAQKAVWASNTHVIPGPVTNDINLADEGGDQIHFRTDAELQAVANRWWAAVKTAFYGGTDGRGPQIVSAAYSATKTDVYLTFDEVINSDTISPSVFTVKSDANPVTVSTVSQPSSKVVMLTLPQAATGTITVSLGSGISGGSGVYPTDTNTYRLPAEPFTDMATTLYVPESTGSGSTSTGTLSGGGGAPVIPVVPVATPSPTVCNTGDIYSALTGARCTVFSNPGIPAPSTFLFTKNLYLKVSGTEVKALQQYLNANGFAVAKTGAGSPGYETNYFGPATKAALIKFQKAKGIVPAAGYFGAITRAYIATH